MKEIDKGRETVFNLNGFRHSARPGKKATVLLFWWWWCFAKVMSIDSAKNTYNYSLFYDQNTVYQKHWKFKLWVSSMSNKQANAQPHTHRHTQRSSDPPAITISMKLNIVQPPPQPLHLATSIGVVCMTVQCLQWAFLSHTGSRDWADGTLTQHFGGFGENQ